MNLISVKKLWENDAYVGGCTDPAIIPCEKITRIDKGYLRRNNPCCGNSGTDFVLTFDKPLAANGTDLETNAIEGYWIEYDGKGILVDATTQAQIKDACNACCDDTVTVAGNYGSGVPAMTTPATSMFCVTRADDGGQVAYNKMALDYYGKYETLVLKSNLNGSSTYELASYAQPTPHGADTVVAGACSVPTVPATPTSPVTDDTANTFDWTNTAGYTAVGDYEKTTDSGATYSAVTAKPITGLTGAHGIGTVGVRVKAAGINPPSATLYNAVAFT